MNCSDSISPRRDLLQFLRGAKFAGPRIQLRLTSSGGSSNIYCIIGWDVLQTEVPVR
ncbi:hypothetical protein FOXYSP1_15204 [Fusarium oxysporum f. sp. phaseoli]